jgi:hypothetical protein
MEKKPRSFRLVWELDVDAETPEEAVALALGYIQDGTASAFGVKEWVGEAKTVNLGIIDAGSPGEEIKPKFISHQTNF